MSTTTVEEETNYHRKQEAGRQPRTGKTSATLVLLALLACVLVGDWLLWTDYPSLSLALFLAIVCAVHAVVHRQQIVLRDLLFGSAILFGGLIPLVEVLNPLSFLIATGAAFACCLIFRGNHPDSWAGKIDHFITSSLLAVFRFPSFISGMAKAQSSEDGSRFSILKTFSRWVMPLGLASIFIVLFQQANPVLEAWLAALDLERLINFLLSGRFLFWVALAWLVWPLVEGNAPVRLMFSSSATLFGFALGSTGEKQDRSDPAFFLRCLVLFNLVFAVQTLMDISYLWGGASLPEGMSYASYAHRGAYPLVVAALMAAVFVVVAMRPGGPGETSVVVKWLVLVWVAQNLMLVGSSVLRLDLYIKVYALTYWRIAAFIWMGLVAAGLVLIVVRFMTGRSSGWLVCANVAALAGVLYATSLTNLPGLIMSYNLRHAASATKTDWRYLRYLGPAAYPAVIEYVADSKNTPDNLKVARLALNLSKSLEYDITYRHKLDWRAWNFRGQRSYWVYQSNAEKRRAQKPRPSIESYTP